MTGALEGLPWSHKRGVAIHKRLFQINKRTFPIHKRRFRSINGQVHMDVVTRALDFFIEYLGMEST